MTISCCGHAFGGEIRRRAYFAAMMLVVFGSGHALSAATLSDAAVDRFNVRVGTQTFAGLYQFTTNTLLVESAQAIAGLGSDIIKFYLGADFSRQYRLTLPQDITNLTSLVRDESSCRQVFDLPFRHYLLWAYPFGNSDAAWKDGYSAPEKARDYRELYDLTRYLLTHYDNSGKTFYLGHWEGDGYLAPWTTNPPPAAIQGMIDWLNNRQQAIDDAKRDIAFQDVNVFGYAEVNRVRDAMLNGSTNNQRVINRVIPYVTNLDYVSYSSYDAMNLGAKDLAATLDYIESKLPANKAKVLSGERFWIGEYGWGGLASEAQEPLTRAYLKRLLQYGREGLPFLLFWEIYNNEVGRSFWLIDAKGAKTPVYFLHQRFINQSRLLVARFKETQGRLPTNPEFVALVAPMLDQPLTAPVSLTVSNSSSVLVDSSLVRVSGQLRQGVYGDDGARVWVFWGRHDGATAPSAWENSQCVGTNSHFNPTTFSTGLTNLVSPADYYFRFYATNAGGDAWAPASEHFRTVTSISTPALSFSAANQVLLLTWPANAGAFLLYSTTNLAPPAAWIRVVDSVVFNDGEWQVRIQPDDQAHFYRLQSS